MSVCRRQHMGRVGPTVSDEFGEIRIGGRAACPHGERRGAPTVDVTHRDNADAGLALDGPEMESGDVARADDGDATSAAVGDGHAAFTVARNPEW